MNSFMSRSCKIHTIEEIYPLLNQGKTTCWITSSILCQRIEPIFIFHQDGDIPLVYQNKSAPYDDLSDSLPSSPTTVPDAAVVKYKPSADHQIIPPRISTVKSEPTETAQKAASSVEG